MMEYSVSPNMTPNRDKSRTSINSTRSSLNMSTPNSRRFSSPMTSNSPNNVNSRLSVGSSHSSLPSPGVSYSDRLIPSRRSSNLEEAFDIMDATNSVNAVTSFSASNLADGQDSNLYHLSYDTRGTTRYVESQENFNNMLRNELMGFETISQHESPSLYNSPSLFNTPSTSTTSINNVIHPSRSYTSSSVNVSGSSPASSEPGVGVGSPSRFVKSNVLKYSFSSAIGANTTSPSSNKFSTHNSPADYLRGGPGSEVNGLGVNSATSDSKRKVLRKISKKPYKILDAPSLGDDFYLNLVDWSTGNVIAVALGNSVFLWSANTSKVTQLCDLSPVSVTSVNWSTERSNYLAIGMNSGVVSIWDAIAHKRIRDIHSHSARVGVMSWNPASSSSILATGSRDKHIHVHDIRIRGSFDTTAVTTSTSPSLGLNTSFSTSVPSFAINDGANGTTNITNSAATMTGAAHPVESASHGPLQLTEAVWDEYIQSLGFTDRQFHHLPSFRSIPSLLHSPETPLVDLISQSATRREPSSQSIFSSPEEFPSRDVSPDLATDINRDANANTDHRLDALRYLSSVAEATAASLQTFNQSSFQTLIRPTAAMSNLNPALGLDQYANTMLATANNPLTSISPANGLYSLSSSAPDSGPVTSSCHPSLIHNFSFHKQEVCGLKWSFDGKYLASGGNDNRLLIWSASKSNSSSTEPLYEFNEHVAAVKAVAWSPHQSGLLVSGGGTADRHIRFWNTNTGKQINKIDTGSQVCNIMWCKNVNELVSTHGYSLNQVIIWKYPTMQKLAALTGHSYRVLYLAGSPDGTAIVTGAGDETLRFWNVFPGPKNRSGSYSGQCSLIPSTLDMR